MTMNVLVACEFSATVRDAFRARGHNAWSVDLLPTEGDSRYHIVGDGLAAAHRPGWDLVIAHPPCTYLANSGVQWLTRQPGRVEKMRQAGAFFKEMLDAPALRVAVENPIMHRYAVEIVGRKQDQVVQPWMFGHTESKATGLWLKGLPALVPTNNVKAQALALPARERDRVHHASPGPDRWKLRSRTYKGIAEAMAEQWGDL